MKKFRHLKYYIFNIFNQYVQVQLINFRNVFIYKSLLRNSIFMKFDIFTKWTSETKKECFLFNMIIINMDYLDYSNYFYTLLFFLMFMCEIYIGTDNNFLSSWNLKFKSQKFEFWWKIQVRKTVQYIYIIKLFAHTCLHIYIFIREKATIFI